MMENVEWMWSQNMHLPFSHLQLSVQIIDQTDLNSVLNRQDSKCWCG